MRLTLTLSSISSHETTNSRDLGTALVLGCSHRTVIPAVALRASSRWGKVMDQVPFCGLQARLWTLQEINTFACPGWVGGGTARLRFHLWILQELVNRFDHPTCRRSRQEKISNQNYPCEKSSTMRISDCTSNGPKQLNSPQINYSWQFHFEEKSCVTIILI